MPVTFKSQATGPLLMLSAHAEALLQVLGKNAAAAGILEVTDMPAALVALRALDPVAPSDAPDAGSESRHGAPDPDEAPVQDSGFADEAVSLRQRAVPLIRMIEQAHAGGKPIVWGV